MMTVNITNEAYQLKLDMSRTDAPTLGRLVSAKNDSAAFQIILQSDLQYSVCVTKTDWYSHRARLRGPHERIRVAVSSPFGCELNPEGFMVGDDDLEVADVLLQQDVIEQKANLPVAVWADVKVPADAEAGQYAITVKVFRSLYGQDEELVFTQEIPLTVATVISCAAGMAFNIVADPLVGYFYKMYVLGVPQEAASIWAKIGAVTTSVNAVVAVVAASVLYIALRKAMKRTNMLPKL